MARISYDNPCYKYIEDKVQRRFRSDFNAIPLEVIEKLDENWYEHIIFPEIKVDEIFADSEAMDSYFEADTTSEIQIGDIIEVYTDEGYRRGKVIHIEMNYDATSESVLENEEDYFALFALEDEECEQFTYYEREDELNNYEKLVEFEGDWYTKEEYIELLNEKYDERQEEVYNNIGDVIWGTVFEATDSYLAEELKENVKWLYDHNMTLIEIEDFNVCIGVRGAGYDFYEAHWIPLYVNCLKWIEPKTVEDVITDCIQDAISKLYTAKQYCKKNDEIDIRIGTFIANMYTLKDDVKGNKEE